MSSIKNICHTCEKYESCLNSRYNNKILKCMRKFIVVNNIIYVAKCSDYILENRKIKMFRNYKYNKGCGTNANTST